MDETQIEVTLTNYENEIGSLKHRVNKLEEKTDKLTELVTSVKLLAQKQDTLISTVGELKTDVLKIKEEPGKKWNNASWLVVSGIISAVVGAICAFLIANI